MTPTAKLLGQSLAAETMLNAEISFRHRISSEELTKEFSLAWLAVLALTAK